MLLKTMTVYDAWERPGLSVRNILSYSLFFSFFFFFFIPTHGGDNIINEENK